MALSTTHILIFATVALSMLAWRDRDLLDRLVLWPPAVYRQRQYWRLLSYGLVHADGPHLLFNMVTLYFFGAPIEGALGQLAGPLAYPAFYAGGLMVAILPSYLRHRHDPSYRTLGASGAVSAVLFAFILLQPWALLFVFFIPVPAIVFAAAYLGYGLWSSRRGGDNVNHSAHLWGAAYGIGFMLAIEPRLLALFWQRLLAP